MDTLTPAEAAQLLGTSPNRVRQLLRDGKLMAVPGSGNGKIPADFLQDGAVLKHLPGLLTVLRDGGFSDQEAFDWLFREDESLPGTPVQALRDDRHTEVTRRAQALAF
ncbi:MAG TPA: Rv2175c family DNA-binding protein [Blastococcus sp.]|jgi:excisionase family DNA binding protein